MANNSITSVKPEDKNAKKRIDGTRLFLIIFAAVALVGIVFALVFGIVRHVKNQPIDYYKDNLGKYISISPDDYKSYEVLVNLDPVTEMSIQNEINKLLYNNRKETDGKNKVGQTIKVGDTANLYYYGYTLGENGEKVAFDGGCNFTSSVTPLGIGSGQMIPGFELALIGKNSADYATMTKKDSGKVEENNFVYITYTVAYFDGTAKKDATALIDLSKDVDAEWGNGFKEYLLGAEIGKKIGEAIYCDRYDENGIKRTDIYSDVTVNKVIEFSDGEPLTIDVTFPRPYNSSPKLAGKDVKFDIYIITSVSYDTPEFNDEFITETLKVKAEDLDEFEGETLTDKYRAKIKADLDKTYEDNLNAAIESAYWEHLRSTAKVKNLPESEVNAFYISYYAEVESYYNNYSSYFTSLDQAARQYLGLSANADWKAQIRENAENSVTEKLLFYYIIRAENLIPTGEVYEERYNKLYNDMLESYLEQYKVVREDYDTEEKYQEQVDIYRNIINTNYGESYFRESVYFEYAMETLRSYATLKYAN